MNKNHSPFYTEQELKSGFDFSPWGGIEGFLQATSNGATANNRGMALKRIVPDLSRAVNMTATAVSSLPFDMVSLDDGKVVDTSDDWKNVVGGFDDPRRLFYLIASSLCGGAAYVLPTRTPRFLYELQYLVPHSITPQIRINGLEYFDRSTDQGKTDTLKPKELIYFWLPDSDVEIGPALNTPLSNAMNDALLLLNTTNTMRTYGERGFVPITLLAAKGMPDKSEREKAEGYFDRLLRGGFKVLAKIFNADALSVERLGAGMEELKGSYTEVRQQSREAIAQAFGIPAALFMADKAFASEVDTLTRQWYTTSVFRNIYQTVEGTFSSQLLKPYGVKLQFDLNRLDIFQEDEESRAGSVGTYVNAIQADPRTAKLVMDFMGVDLSEEEEKELNALIAEKEANREKVENNLDDPKDGDDDQSEQVDSEQDENKSIPANFNLSPEEMKDLSLWYSKAVAWHPKGKSAADWDNKHLREDIAQWIRVRLAGAKTLDDIKNAFMLKASDNQPVPPSGKFLFAPEVKALADSINKAVDAIQNKPD